MTKDFIAPAWRIAKRPIHTQLHFDGIHAEAVPDTVGRTGELLLIRDDHPIKLSTPCQSDDFVDPAALKNA